MRLRLASGIYQEDPLSTSDTCSDNDVVQSNLADNNQLQFLFLVTPIPIFPVEQPLEPTNRVGIHWYCLNPATLLDPAYEHLSFPLVQFLLQDSQIRLVNSLRRFWDFPNPGSDLFEGFPDERRAPCGRDDGLCAIALGTMNPGPIG